MHVHLLKLNLKIIFIFLQQHEKAIKSYFDEAQTQGVIIIKEGKILAPMVMLLHEQIKNMSLHQHLRC